jgi:FtsH-binding integral membrane protein
LGSVAYTFLAIAALLDDVEAHLGILGALSLYLDFINLFLFLLRLGGRRR